MTIENRDLVLEHQAKGLLDTPSDDRFRAVYRRLGIKQRGTAVRELLMLAVEVAELFTAEQPQSVADLEHLFKSCLMELDIARLEREMYGDIEQRQTH